MAKAIYLKNESDGIGLRGLSRWPHMPHGWRSCCWLLNEEEQQALRGGWLYLHPTKSAAARFAGQIIDFEPAERVGAARSAGVAIIFRADNHARGQAWRGANHGMAWSSGIIEADLPHEQD